MPSCVFDKCCICIDLKTGCFIIGYFNLVLTIIATILTLLALIGGAVLTSKEIEGIEHSQEAGALVMIVSAILLLFFVLLLAFVITLLVGLHKNKPGHLKAYLIYAVIFLVLYVIQFIVGVSSSKPTPADIVENLLVLLLNFYSILVIRSMYYQMKGTSRGPAIYSAP